MSRFFFLSIFFLPETVGSRRRPYDSHVCVEICLQQTSAGSGLKTISRYQFLHSIRSLSLQTLLPWEIHIWDSRTAWLFFVALNTFPIVLICNMLKTGLKKRSVRVDGITFIGFFFKVKNTMLTFNSFVIFFLQINLKWKSFELTERAKRWGNLELYTQVYNCSNWTGASRGRNTWRFPSARNSPHPLGSRKHRYVNTLNIVHHWINVC